MQIWNTTTKVSDIIIDNTSVPEGWTTKPPKWCEYEKWDDVSDDWIIDTAAKSNAAITVQIAIIDSQIAELENKTYRPLREIAIGLDSNGAAQAVLLEYNNQIVSSRTQRNELAAQLN